MKPKKLIMSAFGSYANLTEIDFDKLGDKGIYLICGNTGSGKTTIFDAISFALYGEASGGVKKAGMFRSLYADSKAETFVELEFECKGKIYKIKRSPQYERAKLRGEGMTLSPAENELIFPKEDGREPVSSAKEVNSEINKIVGIDRHQFAQIAMIAQGDFQKLILADTNERRNIFRKLFNTDIYDKIQQKVIERNSEAKGNFLKKKDAIENLLEMFSFESVEKKEEFKNLATFAEKIKWIQDYIKEDELLEKIFDAEETNLDKEKRKIELFIKEIDDEIEKIKKLSWLKNKKAESEKNLESLKGQLEIVKKEYLAKDSIVKEKSIIEGSLEKYDALDNMVLELNILRKKIAQEENDVKALKTKLENLETKLKESNDFLRVTANLERDFSRLIVDIKEKKTKISELNSIKDSFVSKKKLSDEYVKSTKEYEDALQKYSICKSNELNLERAFISGQAGILAQELEDNMPCPVCGSMNHPQLAKLCDDVPQKEDVDKAKEVSSKMQALMNEKSAAMNNTKGKLETCESLLGEMLKKAGFDINGTETKIDDIIYEDNLALEVMVERQSKIKPEIEKGRIIEDNIPKLENGISEVKEKLASCNLELEKDNREEAVKDSIAESYAKELTFGSKTEAEEKIRALERNIKKIEDNLKKAQNSHKACAEEIERQKASITTISETLKNIGVSGREEWEKKKKTVDENLKKAREVHEIVKSRIRENKKCIKSLESNIEEAEKLEKILGETEELAKTLSGNLKQKTRISLETYVQGAYFDNIIARANKRLLKMTNSQFELVRAKDEEYLRSQSGLGLDVIDHFCNATRSIKTLSGGESFKASLALALGLSDEIQANAGGIKLDTMFIDEGFGTLDDESLEGAMQAFNSLIEGNKLIGIISHVSDLKNRIDKQIVVKKNSSGVSSVKIVT